MEWGISDHTYLDDLGQSWSYQVCTFSFGAVDITGASTVHLRGDKSLQIKTVAGGGIYIGADFILDGGDADTESGYGDDLSLIHGEVEVLKN